MIDGNEFRKQTDKVCEEISNHSDLLKESEGKDIVVALGSTGCGKSTALNWLAGKRLTVVGRCDRIELENPKDSSALPIGCRGASSEFPKSIGINGKLFFDIPEFHGGEGTIDELINVALTQQIIKKAKSVVFLFVVSKDEWEESLNEVVKVVKEMLDVDFESIVQNSSMLLVTKNDCSSEELSTLFQESVSEDYCPALFEWIRRRRVFQMKKPEGRNVIDEGKNELLAAVGTCRGIKVNQMNISHFCSPEVEGILYGLLQGIPRQKTEKRPPRSGETKPPSSGELPRSNPQMASRPPAPKLQVPSNRFCSKRHPLLPVDLAHNPSLSVGRLCDGCGRTISVSETILHCGTCRFDLCSSCWNKDFSNCGYCTKGHPLRQGLVIGIRSQNPTLYSESAHCSNCGREIDHHELTRHCETCNYDICQQCWGNVDQKPCGHCTEGHPLYKILCMNFKLNIYCDGCGRYIAKDEVTRRCTTCNFDLCSSCWGRVDPANCGVCAKGHRLRQMSMANTKKAFCKICGRRIGQIEASRHCRVCKIYFCSSCYNKINAGYDQSSCIVM